MSLKNQLPYILICLNNNICIAFSHLLCYLLLTTVYGLLNYYQRFVSEYSEGQRGQGTPIGHKQGSGRAVTAV